MPEWLKNLRERSEAERRLMAGVSMVVLSGIVFVLFGYSVKNVIMQAPQAAPSVAELQGAGQKPQTGTVAMEQPGSVVGSFFSETLGSIGSVKTFAMNAVGGLGNVGESFRGLDNLGFSDVAEPVMEIPHEWFSATGAFFGRSFAAMRSANKSIIDGVSGLVR